MERFQHQRDTLKVKKSKEDLCTANQDREKYEMFLKNYKTQRKQLETEKKSLKNDVEVAFAILSKQIQDELQELKAEQLRDITSQMKQCMESLAAKKHSAESITKSLCKKMNEQELGKFSEAFDNYNQTQSESQYKQFSMSGSVGDKIKQSIHSQVRGQLRISDVTSDLDRKEFLAEIEPSWGIVPKGMDVNLSSFVKCLFFKFDPNTVRVDRFLHPDGHMENKSSPNRHLVSKKSPPPSPEELFGCCWDDTIRPW